MKTKVLHVLPSMGHGGISTVFRALLERADAEGLVFDTIAFIPGPIEDDVRRQGGVVTYCQLIKHQGPLRYMRRIRQHILSRGPYAAIHVHRGYHDAFTLLAAKIAGVPNRVAHSHASNVEIASHRWLLPVLHPLLVACSTHRLACSHEAGIFAFGTSTFEVFKNALDPARFSCEHQAQRAKIRRQLGLSEETLVMCTVGRLSPVKNHAFLVCVAQVLHERRIPFCALIVGTGPLEAKLQASINAAELAGVVRLLGPRDNIPDLLAASDVFVLPSLHEGVPLAALEAQISGLQCLVSTGVSPQVDLGVGAITHLALNRGARDWATQVIRLAGLPRVDYADAVHGLAKRGYDIGKNVERLSSIYRT